MANYDLTANDSVLLGNGNGTFSKVTPYATQPDSFSVSSGDFNYDSKLDLASINTL